MRLCERGSVVDSVPHHGDHPSLRLQLSHSLNFVGGKHLGHDLVGGYAHLCSDSECSAAVIAGEQDGSQSKLTELSKCRDRRGFHHIRHSERTAHRSIPHHDDDGATSILGLNDGVRYAGGDYESRVRCDSGAADRDIPRAIRSLNGALHAEALVMANPADGGELTGEGAIRGELTIGSTTVPVIEAPGTVPRGIDNCTSDRMLRGILERARKL